MDYAGYALHALAERFNGEHTTTQEAFDRIYGGNCIYHEAQGINVPLYCSDDSYVQNRSETLGEGY